MKKILIILLLTLGISACSSIKKTSSIISTKETRVDSITSETTRNIQSVDSSSFVQTLTRKDTSIVIEQDIASATLKINKRGNIDVIDKRQGANTTINLREEKVGNERIVFVDCTYDSATVAFTYFETRQDVFVRKEKSDSIIKSLTADIKYNKESVSITETKKRTSFAKILIYIGLAFVAGFIIRHFLPVIIKLITKI